MHIYKQDRHRLRHLKSLGYNTESNDHYTIITMLGNMWRSNSFGKFIATIEQLNTFTHIKRMDIR